MQRYLLKRVALSIVAILGVSVLAFSAIRIIPGDVVDVMLGLEKTPEAEVALRHRLGLDRPPFEQYLSWMGRVLQGDMGKSLFSQEPIIDLLRQRMPVTLELVFLTTLVSILIGIPSGIIAAIRQYSIADHLSTLVSMIGLSMPDFWLATLLILLFSVTWKLLPPGGLWVSPFEDLGANLRRAFMPCLAMGLPGAAVYFRITRSSMLEVVRATYMVTAYSKGLTERKAILVHALKNALIPVVTVCSMQVTWLLGGLFIIETIFSLPGMGRATVTAIYKRDYIVLQGSLLAYAAIVIIISLCLDVVYAWLDPRIRYESEGAP